MWLFHDELFAGGMKQFEGECWWTFELPQTGIPFISSIKIILYYEKLDRIVHEDNNEWKIISMLSFAAYVIYFKQINYPQNKEIVIKIT